jgi:hypothetical protein
VAMIKIKSQLDIEFRERFYRCELVENPDPKEVKLWLTLIGDEEQVKEADLINRILDLLNKKVSPENNTFALNFVFESRNEGYIKDIGIPWKHIYKLNQSLTKGGRNGFSRPNV